MNGIVVLLPYLQEPYLFVEQRGSTYYVNTNVGLQVSVICFLLQGFFITLMAKVCSELVLLLSLNIQCVMGLEELHVTGSGCVHIIFPIRYRFY